MKGNKETGTEGRSRFKITLDISETNFLYLDISITFSPDTKNKMYKNEKSSFTFWLICK
jgi:hypothetical protein